MYNLINKSCCGESQAVHYLGWHYTSHTFDFASHVYAKLFMQYNSTKLINVSPEARRLLEASANINTFTTTTVAKPAQITPSIQIPIPAPVQLAPSIQSEEYKNRFQEDQLLFWINRIETLKGPSARKAALEQGLIALKKPEHKERLILEASRIEVQAVLDKVDNLKTLSAKKRTLLNAIDALKSDAVTDETQDMYLAPLQAALKEIETQ